MELTRVKPFGRSRKTYFYALAGLVLAAHVVVGAMVHVMPPKLPAPGGREAIEMKLVERLLPDDVVESSAVQMVEDALREEPEELPTFEPVWEPTQIEPQVEPIGPTESVLPELVPEPVVAPPETKTSVPIQPPPPVKTAPAPEAKPPVKKPPVKKASPRPPVKKKATPPPPPPKPQKKSTPPPPPPVKRATPVERQTGRTGLLNRGRSSQRSAPQKYVQASWRKRPPPYYPYEQRKRGIEGTAHVRVSISSSGRITSARLGKSTGNAQLDRAALLSVKKGTMNPARRGGRAVSSEMIVPFEFYR